VSNLALKAVVEPKNRGPQISYTLVPSSLKRLRALILVAFFQANTKALIITPAITAMARSCQTVMAETAIKTIASLNYQISIVHGQMKPADKDFEMDRFVRGETQIMVATTVIEVGVNVPNASVMVIESAERFGLSQLHQLRGRVGRGAEQSYCILMTSHKLSRDAKTRLQTMTQTNDGFEISEVDLKLRGPGDIMGTQQSGVLNLRIADIVKDSAILKIARSYALQTLKADPTLASEENNPIKHTYSQLVKFKNIWNYIS